MLTNELLSQRIESISVQFILMEPEDTEQLRNLVALFEDISTWAKNNGQTVLESTVHDFMNKAGHHLSSDTTPREDFLAFMGSFLSDLQIHARNDYDFSTLTIQKRWEDFCDAPLHSEPEPPECDPPPAEPAAVPSSHGHLRHPGSLPAHLDMDLFAEFLDIQTTVIDQIEEKLLILENKEDPALLQELKRLFHTQKGEAGFMNLAQIERLCHVTEELLECDSLKGRTDLLFSVVDWMRKTNAWSKGENPDQPDFPHPLIESIENQTRSALNTLQPAMENPENSRQASVERAATPPETRMRQSIRIDAERLDRLIDMIGELVIAETMVVQSAEIRSISSQTLIKNIGQMDKITRSLHEAGLMLRMVPIKETFQKMIRLVRDTAKKSGKTVQCTIQGEETELDKSLVDKIGEPLLHIIRNAVDHGIESSEQERVLNGKTPHGTVHIKAFHKSGYVHIEIADDGKGLNRKAIIDKAKLSGLIHDESVLNDGDIYNLIFKPGFSTAKQVTDLSGRGQGMNVVKDVVESLNGQIDCRSEEGQGCVFILKIPLTLAIIDGMIVRAGHDRYIIPTLSIITSCALNTQNMTSLISKEKTILIQGKIMPLINLGEWLGLAPHGTNSQSKLMVVIESGSRRIALLVDEILGKQQIVIKNLGEGFKYSSGISGAAIMPDGTVGLIVDVDKLAQL